MEVCNRNNNQSRIKFTIMITDVTLLTQEALDAISNGVVQIYDILALYGEEVYNAVSAMV